MKKKLSIIIILSLIFSSFSVNAFALEDIMEEIVVSDDDIEEKDIASEINVANAGLDLNALELGYHGMNLSAKDILDKKELSEYTSKLDDMEPGVDYVDDQITYFADSEEEALEIATCYNAELTFYDYGVAAATIDFSEEIELANAIGAEQDLADDKVEIPTSIEDIIELAASDDNYLPAVYPNGIFKLDSIEIAKSNNMIPYSDDDLSQCQYANHYIKDYKAWEMGITGKNVTVAVIDSGVNYNHIDIAKNITDFKYNSIAQDKYWGSKLGYMDVNNALDDQGHGSHCAGIIGAIRNNNIGISGVAPDSRIMPIKAMDKYGRGFSSWVCAGINAAVKNGADVLSMSLGSEQMDMLEYKTITAAISKGVVVVAAAGNEGVFYNNYPAGITDVISVAALCPYEYPYENLYFPDDVNYEYNEDFILSGLKKINPNNELVLSYFSNYGPTVDIAAPGSMILSLYGFANDKYYVNSGTSQATPIVSGVVSLMLSADESLKDINNSSLVEIVGDIIRNSNDKKEYVNKFGGVVTCGMIDAENAVKNVLARRENIVIKKPTFIYESNKDGSIKSGENRFLEIKDNSNLSGTKIYYTTDGKDPKKYGNLYEHPIKLNFEGNRTIRAVAKFADRFSDETILKASFKADIKSISANKYINIIPGKKAQIILEVDSQYANMPTFAFESSDKNIVTVDKKGVVKANKNAAPLSSATISVKNINDEIITTIPVKIIDKSQLKLEISNELSNGIVMSDKDTVLHTEQGSISVNSVFDLKKILSKDGLDIDALVIKSSKPNVVKYENGKLYAIAKGKTKITLMANDGSNQKRSFNVEVKTYINEFTLYTDTKFSADGIHTVSSAIIGKEKCKVKLLPSFNDGKRIPTNKKLKYEATGAVVVSKSGVVKAAKNALIGSKGRVTATTTDGTNITRTLEFTIVKPIEDIAFMGRIFDEENRTFDEKIAYSKKLNSAACSGFFKLTYFEIGRYAFNTLDIVAYSDKKPYMINDLDNIIGLDYDESDDFFQIYDIEDYMFYFGKVGNKSITYFTRDGSNKKIKLNVKVYK